MKGNFGVGFGDFSSSYPIDVYQDRCDKKRQKETTGLLPSVYAKLVYLWNCIDLIISLSYRKQIA